MKLIARYLVTMDRTPPRRNIIAFMNKPGHKKISRERAYKVNPVRGLVKNISEFGFCWMPSGANNRWLFTAMGLTVLMHQRQAFTQARLTWRIKGLVLG